MGYGLKPVTEGLKSPYFSTIWYFLCSGTGLSETLNCLTSYFIADEVQPEVTLIIT